MYIHIGPMQVFAVLFIAVMVRWGWRLKDARVSQKIGWTVIWVVPVLWLWLGGFFN